jgi:hypothetical protein
VKWTEEIHRKITSNFPPGGKLNKNYRQIFKRKKEDVYTGTLYIQKIQLHK